MTPQAAIPLPETFDDSGFEELKAEIAAYVANEGERWAERIEAERSVPPELRVELKERGYLSLAGPKEYGGAGIPFSRYLELLELFAMSHASLRMIVHVANGVWRAVDQFATPEQRERFVLPAVDGTGVVTGERTDGFALASRGGVVVAPRGRPLSSTSRLVQAAAAKPASSARRSASRPRVCRSTQPS